MGEGRSCRHQEGQVSDRSSALVSREGRTSDSLDSWTLGLLGFFGVLFLGPSIIGRDPAVAPCCRISLYWGTVGLCKLNLLHANIAESLKRGPHPANRALAVARAHCPLTGSTRSRAPARCGPLLLSLCSESLFPPLTVYPYPAASFYLSCSWAYQIPTNAKPMGIPIIVEYFDESRSSLWLR